MLSFLLCHGNRVAIKIQNSREDSDVSNPKSKGKLHISGQILTDEIGSSGVK